MKSTLKYRYYDYNTPNDSPAIVLPTCVPPNPDSTYRVPGDESELRYPSDYTKQNADAQIDFRPWKWLNFGALYDWERWDRDFRNAATTNEHTGKIFADIRHGASRRCVRACNMASGDTTITSTFDWRQ